MSCCLCMNTGRCVRCSCVRSGNRCVDCRPSKIGRCQNSSGVNADRSSSEPEPILSPSNSIQIPREPPFQGCSSALDSEDIGLTLPPYDECVPTSFQWGDADPRSLVESIESAYGEIVCWRRNLFKIPSGKVGKIFVGEVAALFKAYNEAAGLEPVALCAVMTMPALLLQRAGPKMKNSEIKKCLERRIDMWKKGQIDDLFNEAKILQQRAADNFRISKKDEDTAHSFANLIFQGKIKDALRLLSSTPSGGPLSPDTVLSACDDRTVFEELCGKHPKGKDICPSAIVSENDHTCPSHPVIFDALDGAVIKDIASHMKGSAGPSGLDAEDWRQMCCSFKDVSDHLCNTLANTAKCIATSYVDPSGIQALHACRLIALDKMPGVRPIGVGEVAKRILGKAILKVIKEDIRRVVGPLQMCVGYDNGVEVACHAMQAVFEDDNTEAVLLVDAENAFNSMNRKVALFNILHTCPAIGPALINTYRSQPKLFIQGKTLISDEGTTQGDPLAMAMYALAVAPLMKKCASEATEVWFADDASAGGSIIRTFTWWEKLIKYGPQFGYFPKACKSFVVVKRDSEAKAREVFGGTGLNITLEGSKHLGIPLGTTEFRNRCIDEKVQEWCEKIEKLASFARSQPHAAYSALTHGVISSWMYFMRMVPLSTKQLQPLEIAICEKLIPALTGRQALTEYERDLFALPVRDGGMGIPITHQISSQQRSLSQRICGPLVKAVINQQRVLDTNLLQEHAENKKEVIRQHLHEKSVISSRTVEHLPSKLQRQIAIISQDGASSWLSTIPLKVYDFALHKRAFHDAVALRYGWPPDGVPTRCECGKPFSVDHALNCLKGAFPTLRHNEVRDLTASLLDEVCHDVCVEPHLQPLTGEVLHYRTANRQEEARSDISACGFWGSRFEKVFMDVRVFNPNADSYRDLPPDACFKRHEQEKRRQYGQRIREVEHASFSPLVFSTSGGMGKSTTIVYKRLAHLLAVKRDEPYSTVICWMRCRLGFALTRSAIMCLRGCRSIHSNNAPPSISQCVVEGQIPSSD